MLVLLRVKQLLSSFKRFTEEYLNMTPRLLDQAIVCINNRNDFNSSKVEVLEFIEFYKKGTQSGYEISMYQYQLIENARIFLQYSEIRSIDREMVYNCKTNALLPILLLLNNQISLCNIDNTLVEGGLDYSYHSRRSVPSIDQPEHGGYIIIALERQTQDAELVRKINVAHKLLDFAQLKKLSDTRLINQYYFIIVYLYQLI